jgi:hypothetical protein
MPDLLGMPAIGVRDWAAANRAELLALDQRSD